ncbi:HCO3, HCO3-transporter family [Metarhizium album ARSEF 1941]|uniref:HCO3, HCO3-transporter family n=1 Tax=Metarhizium album (strain ARSEF 1941) TaxID=1081103 RepID=A0A0B2WZK4_METAS|nr:HCO3, HCO3-transporter family [Metarhizium album ARSEF 1941]KHN98857.1 HCO3, HCO3-transporter family [Metarhizium album ARSEF 1941]
MALELAGKSAIVTGGGSGICLCFVKLLLGKGCSVVVADISLRPEAAELLDEYSQGDPRVGDGSRPFVLFHKTDVTSWAQLTSLWKTAIEAHGKVDIVVPDAGIFEPAWSSFWKAPRTETNPDTPSRDAGDAELGHYATTDLNLTSPLRLSQMAIGHWTTNRQKGCLVLVGSIAGYLDTPIRPLYHTTKHGIHGFVSCMAPLRDALGIRVGAVAPGPVKTSIWDQGFTMTEEMTDNMAWVDMRDVAQAMYQLVVDEKMGDGTILEVLASGTRVLPRFAGASDELVNSTVGGYLKAEEVFLTDLEANGLRV